jgi:chromosomal replication initiation ATPase DnaA
MSDVSRPTSPEQLVFDLPHRQAMGAEDFLVSASNAAAVALVDRWPDWPTGAAIICGPTGSGKSHLANVWKLRTKASSVSADAISIAGVPDLARSPALVIEDIVGIADQRAIFHILNLVREQRLPVLLTSSVAPGDLPFDLPDLTSRLKALPVAEIAPPDDALLGAILVKLFSDRQLSVDPAIIGFALNRMERSFAAARRLVDAVDREALVQQRKVSRPMVAAVLERENPGT